MEKLTASKVQAVEMAKGIVEARDEKLAFLLQVQEIVKSTTVPDHEFSSCEDLEEEPSPPLLLGIDFKDWFPVGICECFIQFRIMLCLAFSGEDKGVRYSAFRLEVVMYG